MIRPTEQEIKQAYINWFITEPKIIENVPPEAVWRNAVQWLLSFQDKQHLPEHPLPGTLPGFLYVMSKLIGLNMEGYWRWYRAHFPEESKQLIEQSESNQTGEWTSAWKCLPMILKGKEFRYADSGIIIPYESIGLVQGAKGAFLNFQTIKDDLISIIAVSTRNIEWFDKSYVKY
jgi:hypothetical protein